MEATERGPSLTTWQQFGVALLFVVGCLAVGFASGMTADSDSLWYWALEKPFFQPPDWLFGPVWSVLYIVMGVAAFLVWREGFSSGEVQWALLLFVGQLILNVAWTPVFFGAQSVGGGLIVILALLVMLVLTIRQFLRVNKVAGYLLVPYLAWVVYATALNAGIWMLN